MNRRPPHGRVRRRAQLFDGGLSGRAEAEENLREPLARGRALLDGERLGEPFDDRRTDHVAQLLQLFDGRFVDRSKMGDDVRHHHAVDEPGQRRGRRRFAVAVASRFGREDRRQLQRTLEVADEQQILDVAHDGIVTAFHRSGIGFDRQQVEQQPQIQRPHLRGADRRHPRSDALGRIVGHALDFERLRARARQLARVDLRHELSRRCTTSACRRRSSTCRGSLRPRRAATRRPASAQSRAVRGAARCRAPAPGTPARGASWRRPCAITPLATKPPSVASVMRLATCSTRSAALSARPSSVDSSSSSSSGEIDAESLRDVLQQRLDLGRVGPRHEIDDAAQHAEQRRGLRAHARLAVLLEREHELAEPLGIAAHLHAARAASLRRAANRGSGRRE